MSTQDVPTAEQLAADAEAKNRKGFSGSQIMPLSGSTGVNVEASSHATSAMGVTGRATETFKPTDFKTVEGSYPGDHRSKPGDIAATSVQAASGTSKGPRDGMTQAPLSGKS